MKRFDITDSYRFKQLVRLPWITLSELDVSNVGDMSGLFNDLDIRGQDISGWDVSECTDMWGMFRAARYDGCLSGWDVSSVGDMRLMFCNSDFIGDITEWDVSKVRSMNGMFVSSPLRDNPPKWRHKE